jgi:hypothetical protein
MHCIVSIVWHNFDHHRIGDFSTEVEGELFPEEAACSVG